MAPTNPWGTKKPQHPKITSPGVLASRSDDAPKSQYEEVQEDELIALSSIYGEDFRLIEKNQVAWKVTPLVNY